MVLRGDVARGGEYTDTSWLLPSRSFMHPVYALPKARSKPSVFVGSTLAESDAAFCIWQSSEALSGNDMIPSELSPYRRLSRATETEREPNEL